MDSFFQIKISSRFLSNIVYFIEEISTRFVHFQELERIFIFNRIRNFQKTTQLSQLVSIVRALKDISEISQMFNLYFQQEVTLSNVSSRRKIIRIF